MSEKPIKSDFMSFWDEWYSDITEPFSNHHAKFQSWNRPRNMFFIRFSETPYIAKIGEEAAAIALFPMQKKTSLYAARK